jgi:quinol monooxygenase YgiN
MTSAKTGGLGAMMAVAAVGGVAEDEPKTAGSIDGDATFASGGVRAPVNVGLFVRLEAKPGSEDAVEELLKQGVNFVNKEPNTKFWFGLKLGPRTFGIFDAFQNGNARNDHLAGKLAAKLFEVAPDVLAEAPTIEEVQVLTQKRASFRAGRDAPLKVGLAVRLEAKPEEAITVERALINGRPLIDKEEGTQLWFAIKFGKTTFGIVDAFQNDDDRQTHIGSPFAQGLLGAADELLSEPPTIEAVDVLAFKAPL